LLAAPWLDPALLEPPAAEVAAVKLEEEEEEARWILASRPTPAKQTKAEFGRCIHAYTYISKDVYIYIYIYVYVYISHPRE